MILPSKYYFSAEDIKEILENYKELLEKGEFLTMGKYCSLFEEEFAKYLGVKNAISANNGTTALELTLKALNVKGGEVITTTNTFAATAFAIVAAGAAPVFCDILDDLTIDPKEVIKKITPQTKAILLVHIGGLVSPAVEELAKIAEEKNIPLIEDAAHAHGASLNNKMAGAFGKAAAFSFFSTKLMTTGEGGMITTGDDELARRIKEMRNQGKAKSPDSYNPNYHEVIGGNYRLTEFQAIMGLKQLERLDEFIEHRQELVEAMKEELKDAKEIEILPCPPNVKHNYYKFIVFLKEPLKREIIIEKMEKEKGIVLTGSCYERPLHKQPCFKEFVKEGEEFPRADKLCPSHIALNLYHEMTEEQAKELCLALKEVIS